MEEEGVEVRRNNDCWPRRSERVKDTLAGLITSDMTEVVADGGRIGFGDRDYSGVGDDGYTLGEQLFRKVVIPVDTLGVLATFFGGAVVGRGEMNEVTLLVALGVAVGVTGGIWGIDTIGQRREKREQLRNTG